MQQPLQEVQNCPQQLSKQLSNRELKSSSSASMQQPQASTQDLLPVFDLSDFLALQAGQQPSTAVVEQCRQLAECLVKTGCLVVRSSAA